MKRYSKRHLFVFFFAILLFLCLSGCKAGAAKESQIIGAWYTEEGTEFRAIVFEKDGRAQRYSSENFFDRGSWQIAKDGTLKLIDRYNSIITLEVNLYGKDDDRDFLAYRDSSTATKFVRTQREKPTDTVLEADKHLTEKAQLFTQAVKKILSFAPWPLDENDQNAGDRIIFSDDTIAIYGTIEAISFAKIDVTDGHYSFVLLSKTGEYHCTLHPIMTEDYIAQAYRLEISYNGGPIVSSVRHGYVSMAEN